MIPPQKEMFEKAAFKRFNDSYTVRQERIKREGSPYYTWTPGSIPASSSSYIWVTKQLPLSKKYSPLDWVEIANNDVVDLTITINGAELIPCPAGVIRTIDGKAIHSVNIANLNAATASTAGKIVVTLQRQPVTTNSLARGLYGKK